MSQAGELGRVMVLAGGLSHERDVSLRSGRRVSEALREVGVEVEQRDADAGLVSALRSDPPAVVLPVLHGASGEDGSIRELLELIGIPYVGSRPAPSRLAWDKPTAKTLVQRAGLDTPEAVALPEETFRDLGAADLLAAVQTRLGLPLVVKPARGGSALGCSVVRSAEQLPGAMVGCFAYGDLALLERHVAGVEVAVTVLDTGGGPRALPAVEIVPDGGVYDYTSRYTAGMTEFFVPARLDAGTAARVEQAALTAHRELGLRDLSRTDLIITADGGVQFLEVNVAPGLTETSLLPQALDAAGLNAGEVFADLLRLAVSRATDGSRPESVAL